MIIHKILNNNVIVTLDSEGQESIAMGRGLAFSRQVGDQVNPEQIEKYFVPKDHQNLEHFKDLVNEIPVDYFIITDAIIKKAKLVLGTPLNENIYISLSDHLYGAVERQKKNIALNNMLDLEIRRFYSDEYAVGLYAINLIEKELNVRLQDDEAGFIALHLFNAQMEEDFSEAEAMTEMIHSILEMVSDFFKISLDEESLYFFRFMTHLKFFAYRVLSGKTYEEEDERALLSLMSKEKPEVYRCVLEIEDYLFDTYNYRISSEEKLYLVIHISKVVVKSN